MQHTSLSNIKEWKSNPVTWDKGMFDTIPTKDTNMLKLQLVAEECNHRLKRFREDFRLLFPCHIRFTDNEAYIRATLQFKSQWHSECSEVVYLPFKYAGLKIKLDTSFL